WKGIKEWRTWCIATGAATPATRTLNTALSRDIQMQECRDVWAVNGLEDPGASKTSKQDKDHFEEQDPRVEGCLPWKTNNKAKSASKGEAPRSKDITKARKNNKAKTSTKGSTSKTNKAGKRLRAARTTNSKNVTSMPKSGAWKTTTGS
ncbi:14398_t:CDS:2, partial [Acaulospora colombiana]